VIKLLTLTLTTKGERLMFTALAIICLIGDTDQCEAVSNSQIFITEEACLQDKPNADAFANSVGGFVLDYACYNWGVRT
jgi:hypothetical protein